MNSVQMRATDISLKHVKLSKRWAILKAFLIAALGIAVSTSAVPVEIYSNAVWVAGDGSTQVETVGVLKYAYSCGYTNGYPSTMNVNGKEGKTVAFISTAVGHSVMTNALGSDIDFSKNVTRTARTGTAEPVGAITGSYRVALRDIYYTSATPTSYSMTLKNLSAGRTYLVQVWASDGYAAGDRQTKFTLSDGTDSNFFQLDTNNGNINRGEGQVATFKAVAESNSMTLTLNSAGSANNMACFSAIQVRDITPMYWTAASGDWNTTGLNWDPADDTETVWNATTGAGVSAFFTNNATATLTANVWSRDVNVLSNTTIRRVTSSTGTTTLTVMRNLQVDADRTLTVGSGTANQAAVLVVSNAVTGTGTVSIKNDSRIVLGKNAVGSANASIVGDGQDFRGAIQSVDNGDAEWSGQITCLDSGELPRLGAGYNSVLTVSGKVSGNTLLIRSENEASPVGIVVLSNPNNDYTGGTTLFTPLRLGCENAVPVASGLTFSPGVSNPSLDLNGYNQEIRSIAGTTAGSNITNSHATASLLTFNTLSDQSALSLRLTGNLSVLKKGASKMTLGTTCTHTGTTTVQVGTLALTATGEINATARLILAGGTFDVSAKTGYTFTRPLQVTANSSLTGALTLGATTELTFDGVAAALAGGTIAMAGQTLKPTTAASLVAGTDYPLIYGYTDALPILDATGLTVPDGATASLVWSGGLLSLSIVDATTDTTTELAIDPASTGVYGSNIVITATISPAEVPDGTTVHLYAAADLDTIIDSGVLSGGAVQFTVVKPAAGAYSYVAKYMGGGVYRPSQSAASSVTIQQKEITISAISAADKLYDGLTNAVVQYTTSGILAGEPNPVSCVGYYATPEPGELKPVNLTWTMGNPNYVVSGTVALVNANIYEYALWTGVAGDTLWHTASNWDHQLVPNSQAVTARFDAGTTVTLGANVLIKCLLFNDDVTLNGSGTFTFPPQYKTGEVFVATSKTATFNALINNAYEGIPKTGLGTLVLVGNHRFGGKLDVREGVAEINQTTAGALMNRNYTTAENATLRFVCAPIGSAGTQLAGIQWVTGDGIFEVASGYLRVQNDGDKVNIAMSEKGQIIVRNGVKMDNAYAGGNRYASNKANLNIESTGNYGLNADDVRFGSLHGSGEIKADWDSRTLTITGDTDGAFSGILTQKDAVNRLALTKAGPGTQILSGTNTYTGATTIMGGRLTLEGGDNRLSVDTQVIVTNGVFNLGLTQQTLNNNPDFRAESMLAVEVSKTDIGSLTLTNSVDVSSWKMTINNPSVYPKGKRFAVISTGTEQSITGTPTLVDMPSGFIIYNRDNTIYVESPAMIIFFK